MAHGSINRVLHFLRRVVTPADSTEDGELLRRFIAAREEAAFAGLVRGKTLSLCRVHVRVTDGRTWPRTGRGDACVALWNPHKLWK